MSKTTPTAALKDRLLSLTPKVTAVEIPDLGTVHVRPMTGLERELWEGSMFDAAGKRRSENDARARLIIYGLCDETGKLQLGPDDVPAINAIRSDVLTKLAEAIKSVNGIGRENVEERAKNSSTAPAGSSG